VNNEDESIAFLFRGRLQRSQLRQRRRPPTWQQQPPPLQATLLAVADDDDDDDDDVDEMSALTALSR
jgi:hypothetical protein